VQHPCAAAGRQNGLRRTESRQQADQTGVAYAWNQAQAQPGIKIAQGFFTVSSR